MSANVGESYNEQILQATIDGEPYVNENPYPSRIEILLMELKEVIEAGGGVVVDQTYDSTSENAQSGTAVAEAIATIPAQAQADWSQSDNAEPDYIKNKPTLGAAAACGVDTAPASGSTNLITSGAVYTVVGDINTVLEEVL